MKRRRCVGAERAATIRTSWTDSNPRRRFSMCAAKAVIPGLLKSRNKLEKSVAKAKTKRKGRLVLLVASWVLFASIILGGMLLDVGVNKRGAWELALP
ncbi:unnamed protein product [Prunus armeniaca]|uniref:Uncharacterized protein n=1 Tax=Prunus armeniaca TaxID=36596 RepID=A0A6J5TV67_PRUAR|nr:unnamed protein product [Prunus armeniaca]